MPDIYTEAILTFFTYYRLTLHQTLAKLPYKKEGRFADLFAERTIHMAYLLSCEYAYQTYCCRATLPDSAEAVKANLTAISRLYFEELMRFLKDPRNKSPFELCETISKIRDDLPAFFDNHMREEYQSYAFGAVSQFINNHHCIDFLNNLFGGFVRRILIEMEALCFNSLSKITEGRSKREVEEQVRQFLTSLPRLKYCESMAERYLIGSLDTIVKSIKDVNARMESRFECYLWNL
jgi:hypothetical protein